MTSILKLFNIALSAACTCCLLACASDRWIKKSCCPENRFQVFNTSDTSGTGLELLEYAYRPRKCIKDAKKGVSGGILSIELIDPSAVRKKEFCSFRKFFQETLRRASQFNITGMQPVSVFCVVRVSDRRNYLIDNTIRLTDRARMLLEKKDISGFYSHCGTRFVDSAVFESAVAFAVTLYMPPDKEKEFRSKLKYGKYGSTSDVEKMGLLQKIDAGFPVYFSAKGMTGSVFFPPEIPVSYRYGHSLGRFLDSAVKACLASGSGRIMSLQTRRWNELPVVGKSLSGCRGYGFCDVVHERSAELRRDVLAFASARINLSARGADTINRRMDRLAESISWENFYKCSWGLRYNGFMSPAQEPDCRDLLEGLENYRILKNTYPAIDSLNSAGSTGSDTFRELILVDRSAYIKGAHGRESDYRLSDKTVLAEISDDAAPGQTMDREGRFYSDDCFVRESVKLLKSSGGAVCSVRSDCMPAGFREWGLLKKILLFWKTPPARRPLYRGNLEVTGFSDELCDDFRITAEAADLAKRDLPGFYRKYGTHYVSQVKGRRGLVYYFSIGSKGDKDIETDHYGTAETVSEMPDNANLQEGGCLASFLTGLLKGRKENPVTEPETVKQFFDNRENLAAFLQNSSAAVPVELYLKPWSEYLLDRGIIRADQAAPAKLMRGAGDTGGEVAFTDTSGSRYEGMINNGLKNGYGVLKTAAGSRYEGSWEGGLMHGRGVYMHKNGNVYTGDFFCGYPHGKGEYTRTNGNVYKGTVYRGRVTGRGMMHYKDGRVYRGEFRDGRPDGRGVMEYPDGRTVEGFFKKGDYSD